MNDESSSKNISEAPAKPKSNRNKIIIAIIAIVGVIVLCCCGALVYGAYLNSTPEAQATATVRAQEQEATRIESTAIAVIEATEESRSTNTPVPTETPEPTSTSAPSATPAPTNTPTNTPITPSAVIPLESGGLGLFTAEWEQNHQRTELDWGIGTGYDHVYDVLFQQDKVWIIYRNFDIPATLDDVNLISSQLIPFDSEYIETYTPTGRPETTVIVYRSDFLTTKFDADFWNFAEAGIFIVQYNTYEGFGIGDMIIGLDNNP